MITVLRQDFFFCTPPKVKIAGYETTLKSRVVFILHLMRSHWERRTAIPKQTPTLQCEAALYVKDNSSSVLSHYSCNVSSSSLPLFFSFSLLFTPEPKKAKNAAPTQTQQITCHLAAACDISLYELYIQRREGTRLLFSARDKLLYLFRLSLTGCICHSRESRGGDVVSLQTNHFISQRRRQHDWPWSTRRVA